MSEKELNVTPVVVIPKVQGMHCLLKGVGTVRCTVTMSDVSLTVYSTVNLFDISERSLEHRYREIMTCLDGNKSVDKNRYLQDLKDFLSVLSKVQKTQMFVAGQQITTYAIGEPVTDEKDGFLHLSPERKEWWSHPRIQPVVESIQEYFPDFSPWLLQKDVYISILMRKSGLL